MFLFAGIIASSIFFGSSKAAYAHTFTSDESAVFQALMQQMSVEVQLAKDNSNDASLAEEHARNASELLSDEVVKEISERNNRIGADLPSVVADLETSISSGIAAGEITQKAGIVESLIGEAVLVRVPQEQRNNATTNAQTFAILVNAALDRYYKAVPPEDVTNTESSDLLEKETSGGRYKVQVSWSPPEIMAGRANTYTIKFVDPDTNELLGNVRYAFMFMPADDPDTMIIHRAGQAAPEGQDTQSFEFREKRVGPNTLRISEIYNTDEYADFPVNVLPPADGATSTGETTNTIASMSDYQSAQLLADRLQDLFADLRQSAPEGTEQFVADADSALKQLKTAVDNKASVYDVEIIVHSQIHPNLMKIFNLQIIPEFPLPMLMAIFSIAGVLLMTRLGKGLLPRWGVDNR